MKTTLYLMRHGATAANLAKPYLLQGRGIDGPLADEGVRQAKRTRELFACRPLACIYSSPLYRAVQTANIIAENRSLDVRVASGLTECDVGRWENKTWEEIRRCDGDLLDRFLADPFTHGYPEGENLAQVHERAAPVLNEILRRHRGESILVVGHQVVNRAYLSRLLGLPSGQVRRIKLDNCGVSVLVEEDEQIQVATLNATFHLAAA